MVVTGITIYVSSYPSNRTNHILLQRKAKNMVSQGKDLIYGQAEMRKCRRVTEIKTLQIMLYDEMAYIVHGGNICLRSVTSSILVS